MNIKIMTGTGQEVIQAESCGLFAIHRTWNSDSKAKDWTVTFVPNGYAVTSGFSSRQIARSFVKAFKELHVEKTRLVNPSINSILHTAEERELKRQCIEIINQFKTGRK